MRILVTNDDGVFAPGILALHNALQPLGDVYVVAPERARSAASHAITLHKPLRLERVALPHGGNAWSCNGTPADCVTLGIDIVMGHSADIVVAGVNAGRNLGWDLFYSGTVAAAMQGTMLSVPSIAVSLATDEGFSDFHPAAIFASRLVQMMAAAGLAAGTLLNVNCPALPIKGYKGVAITHQGTRPYRDRVVERVDPTGRPYYWITGTPDESDGDPASDVNALAAGNVSITPVHLNLTEYGLQQRLLEWDLQALLKGCSEEVPHVGAVV